MAERDELTLVATWWTAIQQKTPNLERVCT